MGYVPGRRTVLDDLDAYARELAHGMALIHDVAPPAVDGLPDTRAIVEHTIGEETCNRHGSTPTPAFWSVVRDGVDAVTWPDPVLIHDDFHPGNVLFDGGRLSAVVDWPLAASGPPACDVAFCRLDAGLMLGLEVADAILAAYEAETGALLDDIRWWDLYAASRAETDLVVWTESYAGLAAVGLATVEMRFADFVRQAR
jgi:aminoglycoside phosphotransferase (APT) family kinase protein